jgi:hypothetical protein
MGMAQSWRLCNTCLASLWLWERYADLPIGLPRLDCHMLCLCLAYIILYECPCSPAHCLYTASVRDKHVIGSGNGNARTWRGEGEGCPGDTAIRERWVGIPHESLYMERISMVQQDYGAALTCPVTVSTILQVSPKAHESLA